MEPFRFKQFSVRHDRSTIKVGTDAVLLGAWTDQRAARRILDVGTGCGVLALIAAQRAPDARIDAVDIDEASAEEAAANALASPWADRIRVHRMDARRMSSSEPYDLIISNPPYYGGEMASATDRLSAAKHDGALGFRELVEVVAKLLAPDGRFSVIVPANREQLLVEEAASTGLRPWRRCAVHYVEGRPPKRVLLEFGRKEVTVENEEIVVNTMEGLPGERYRRMTSDLLLGH